MNLNQQIGDFGQKLAADYLVRKNYQILAANFFTKGGELDLIAQINGQVVFIEVKTRLSDKYGLPEEAVTPAKKEKMRLAAYQYLEANQINHDNFRFDIIAVFIDREDKKAIIRHYKNIGFDE